eukprot:9578896-Heterocapsa_arctica.AAC.1
MCSIIREIEARVKTHRDQTPNSHFECEAAFPTCLFSLFDFPFLSRCLHSRGWSQDEPVAA